MECELWSVKSPGRYSESGTRMYMHACMHACMRMHMHTHAYAQVWLTAVKAAAQRQPNAQSSNHDR